MVKIHFGTRFKKELGIWQICANASMKVPAYRGFRPSFMLSCMKLNSLPEDGCMIGKENYSGFILSVELSFDCVVKQKYFVIPQFYFEVLGEEYREFYEKKFFNFKKFTVGFSVNLWKYFLFVKTTSGRVFRIIYPIRIRPKLYFGL